ncbi:MAG: hypothetical protein ACI959_001280, partial [Limisphaerales bacterium]
MLKLNFSYSRKAKCIFLSLFLLLAFISCSESPDITPEPEPGTLKVLFVGNSYTYYNDGLDQALYNMILADDPQGTYVFDRATDGGLSLAVHVNREATLEKLTEEEWDYVVLQEQSTNPVNNPEIFYDGARDMDSLIKIEVQNVDVKTAFFMTWARGFDPDMIIGLESAYSTIATELEATLAAVGKAWEYSLSENPSIILH